MTESDIEFRASQLADVNFPRRTIELIVMPYEAPSDVAYRGRTITEVVSRGAFDGVEQRTSQVRVNRGHIIDAAVGKTVALHPSRQEGLIAEVRISRTDLGEETLVLADDGVLAASAGFALMRTGGRTGTVKPNAEVWETRDRRRLNELFLDHIAMTPDPAYEGARVLAVRAAQQTAAGEEGVAGMPNRDRLRLAQLAAVAADIDRRYSQIR